MQPQTRTRLDCQIACIAHIWQRARMAHVLIRIMSCFRADIARRSPPPTSCSKADSFSWPTQPVGHSHSPSAVWAINGGTMLELQIVVSLIKN